MWAKKECAKNEMENNFYYLYNCIIERTSIIKTITVWGKGYFKFNVMKQITKVTIILYYNKELYIICRVCSMSI